MWRRPSARKARTASPVAGGADEANAAVTGSLWRVPQTRASRATAWLASGSAGAGRGEHERVELADPGGLERLAHPHVEHLEERRLEAEDRRGADLEAAGAGRSPRRRRAGTSTLAW